ncbi:hypothetical protein BH24ACT5_BH24ACT5_23350 [soil metagenome]
MPANTDRVRGIVPDGISATEYESAVTAWGSPHADVAAVATDAASLWEGLRP